MSRKKPIPEELAVYEGKLPPPLELAMMADAVGPHDNYKEALRNAGKRYMEAVEFWQAYEKASVEERAMILGDTRTILTAHLTEIAVKVPILAVFPGTLDDFLKRVVKAKKETIADPTKRLRDFFRAQCPPDSDPETYAPEQIQKIKDEGLTKRRWFELGCAYLTWWKQEKSKTASQSGNVPKKKKSTSP